MQAIPAHFFGFTQEQLKQTAPTNQVHLRNEPALFQLDWTTAATTMFFLTRKWYDMIPDIHTYVCETSKST